MISPRLTADDFSAWFRDAHGVAPYRWQDRLLRLVLDQGWPALLDMPTGSGKTAAIDIALFALACRPDAMPRRIIYVVDRRIIVSQTAKHAEKLRAALTAGRTRESRAVATALRSTASSTGSDTAPFAFAELRGGIARDEGWSLRPDTPTVVVSTVDQVGSRLLFRGYGISSTMRPIHAGLLGNDCLFLLDEVHLSRPFAQTLRALDEPRLATVRQLPRRWQVVEMSATPGNASGAAFRLQQADLAADPELAARIGAVKRTRLRRVGDSRDQPEDVLSAHLPALGASLPGQTVGVVVNRVETARRVAAALATLRPDDTVHLVTGRMRPVDRERVLAMVEPAVVAGRQRTSDGPRVFLVATQTIEAGADFDLDALVTEIAPLDALRQRLGRVDRRGQLARAGTPATVEIVAAAAQTSTTRPDVVYGDAVAATWNALHQRHGQRVFDAGPDSDAMVFVDDAGQARTDLLSPSGRAPLLLRHHLELLGQTWPEPQTSPEVAYWLHGDEPPHPEISIVWRADVTDWHLAPEPGDDRVVELLSACPPRGHEALDAPLAAARQWLTDTRETAVADVEGGIGDTPTVSEDQTSPRRVLRWDGADSVAIAVTDIRAGDTVVVPATAGGLTVDGVWDPTSTAVVADLGDHPGRDADTRPTLRVNADVLTSLGVSLPHGTGTPRPATDEDAVEAVDLSTRIQAWLEAVAQSAAEAAADVYWLVDVVRHVKHRRARRVAVRLDRHREQFVVVGPRIRRHASESSGAFETDSSDVAHSFIGAAVELHDHCRGVGERAAAYARACGATPVADDLNLAGRLHDLGKADPRFQTWLLGGDEIAARSMSQLFAKSAGGRRDTRQREAERNTAGYPRGLRHELLSVALAASDAHLLDDAGDPDLVLHLVATHHGRCRGLPPPQHDPETVNVAVDVDGHRLRASSTHGLDALAAGIPARQHRLVERYGWYGLAWLEAVLRLADHRQSASEEIRA